MKAMNMAKLAVEGIEKCWMHIEADCPLGDLCTFSSHLKAFLIQQIEAQKNPQVPVAPVAPVDPAPPEQTVQEETKVEA